LKNSNQTQERIVLSVISVICLGFLIGFAISNPPPNFRNFTFLPETTYGVTFFGFSLNVIVFLICNYIIIALFGYALASSSFFMNTDEAVVFKFLASFFIGYVCIIGVIRLSSLIFGYPSIYWPCIIVTVLFLFISVLRCLLSSKLSSRFIEFIKTPLLLKNFIILIFFSVFLIFILIHQIRQGSFAWNGHGPDQYAYLINEWKELRLTHFPIIKKHYDELIFHYFLTNILKPDFNPILTWWMTLGIIKISMFSFFYLVFRKLQIPALFSIISCLYLFLGTTAIVPSRYYLLFDAGNPITT